MKQEYLLASTRAHDWPDATAITSSQATTAGLGRTASSNITAASVEAPTRPPDARLGTGCRGKLRGTVEAPTESAAGTLWNRT